MEIALSGLQSTIFLQKKSGFNWLKYEHLESMSLEKKLVAILKGVVCACII